MKLLGLTLSAFLVTGLAVLAQAPTSPTSKKDPPPATVPTADAKAAKNLEYLDRYLKAWEDRMAGINGLETKVVLTQIDAGPPETKTVLTGEASLAKPNYAKLLLKELRNEANTKKWKHFVADGAYLWDYRYGTKMAYVLQLPKEGIGDNSLMTFLFGMKAADIKRRYDLSIDVFDKEKFSDHYLHITIVPKLKEDLQEFKKAELVLWKNNKDAKYADLWMLPARLWFQSPNGDQTIWEFQQMATKREFAKTHFKAPGFPDKEWKSDWVKPPTPTVSRTVAPAK